MIRKKKVTKNFRRDSTLSLETKMRTKTGFFSGRRKQQPVRAVKNNSIMSLANEKLMILGKWENYRETDSQGSSKSDLRLGIDVSPIFDENRCDVEFVLLCAQMKRCQSVLQKRHEVLAIFMLNAQVFYIFLRTFMSELNFWHLIDPIIDFPVLIGNCWVCALII